MPNVNSCILKRRAASTYPRCNDNVSDLWDNTHRVRPRQLHEQVSLQFFSQALSHQFFKQRLRLLQVFRVKPFGEPVVDLG